MPTRKRQYFTGICASCGQGEDNSAWGNERYNLARYLCEISYAEMLEHLTNERFGFAQAYGYHTLDKKFIPIDANSDRFAYSTMLFLATSN